MDIKKDFFAEKHRHRVPREAVAEVFKASLDRALRTHLRMSLLLAERVGLNDLKNVPSNPKYTLILSTGSAA